MTVKPGWARKRPAVARRLPSTTDEPREEPASGARSIWDLNRDEQRMMMITVVGGLGSILLGVVIVGVALGLARWNGHTTIPWGALWVLAPTALVCGLLTGAPVRPLRLVAIGLLALDFIVLLLIWIGQVAGIK